MLLIGFKPKISSLERRCRNHEGIGAAGWGFVELFSWNFHTFCSLYGEWFMKNAAMILLSCQPSDRNPTAIYPCVYLYKCRLIFKSNHWQLYNTYVLNHSLFIIWTSPLRKKSRDKGFRKKTRWYVINLWSLACYNKGAFVFSVKGACP